METVRQTAMFCVGRAVLFGCLAVGCVMFSFAFNGVLFFRSGGILMIIMALILLWFALTAHKRRPGRSETWILLPEEDRPRNEHAVRAFHQVQKEVYGYFAYYAVLAGLSLIVISVMLDLLGLGFEIGRNADYPSHHNPIRGSEP